ncbi:MAG: polysaccharide biosynthesis C-terminal domain-containing protein [Nitrososphaerales archaeon]
MIAVRFLHIQNFGVIAFLDSIFSLLGAFFMPLTHQAEQRYIPELMAQGRYPQVRRLIKVGQRLNILLAFSFAFPFLAFAGPIANLLGNPTWAIYIQLMAITMVISAGLGILKAILNSFYDQKFLGIWESFFSFASLVLLITFVVFLNWGVTGAILVGLVTYGASGLLYLHRMNSKYAHNVKGESEPIGKTLTIRIRKYVIPTAAISVLSLFGSTYGGVLFLGLLKNPAEVAYFDIPNTFVNRVFTQVQLVIGALGLVSLVEVNVRDPTRLKAAAQRFTKFGSIYVLPVTLGGIVLASPILTVLYGSQALPAVLPFRILMIETGIYSLVGISGVLFMVLEKAYRAFIWNALYVVLLTVLNILLIPSMGVMGAVIALSVSDVTIGLIFTYDVSIRLKVGNIIPLGAIAKTTLASLLMAIVLIVMEFFFPVVNAVSLGIAMVVGLAVFLFGLRILQVFDDTDRRMIESSSLPLKRLLLKFLWKGNGQ